MILQKVPGWMLLTPKAFIFDPDSPDPLDQLEPEMFQVGFSSLELSSFWNCHHFEIVIIFGIFIMVTSLCKITSGCCTLFKAAQCETSSRIFSKVAKNFNVFKCHKTRFLFFERNTGIQVD